MALTILVVWRPDTGAWYARTLTGAIIVSNFAWGTVSFWLAI